MWDSSTKEKFQVKIVAKNWEGEGVLSTCSSPWLIASVERIWNQLPWHIHGSARDEHLQWWGSEWIKEHRVLRVAAREWEVRAFRFIHGASSNNWGCFWEGLYFSKLLGASITWFLRSTWPYCVATGWWISKTSSDAIVKLVCHNKVIFQYWLNCFKIKPLIL